MSTTYRYVFQDKTARSIFAGLLAAAMILLLFQGACTAEKLYGVKRVNDGDTITLTDGRLVRYIGVDTPEIDYQKRRAEPLAYEARDFNRRLINNAHAVQLILGKQVRDRYGRLLAYVFLKNGTFINAAILRQGYGFFLYAGKNDRYRRELLAAQRAGMSDRRGVWRNWREPAKAYVGNRRSMRLHLASCPRAEKISRHNRVLFKSSWEALWMGYAPARGCMKKSGRSQ